MQWIRMKWLPAVLVLLTAACSPAFPTIQPEAPADSAEPAQAAPTDTAAAATEPTAESEAPTDLPTDTAVPAVEPTEAEQVVEAEPTAAEDCPYRPNLHATNPATVSLAAGQVQLVEFFAFW